MCAGVVWHNIANRSYMHIPISLNVLRTCADQLHSIQSYIFNLPLSHGTVPMIWKICCIVPVPKNKKTASESYEWSAFSCSNIMYIENI